mmetsp:Transcript_35549/g.53461  ORF Transcript_35549/g.53461 Transcript_35549/m.53461 type:complete len:146 (-) Transcript_35549:135-572(-)
MIYTPLLVLSFLVQCLDEMHTRLLLQSLVGAAPPEKFCFSEQCAAPKSMSVTLSDVYNQSSSFARQESNEVDGWTRSCLSAWSFQSNQLFPQARGPDASAILCLVVSGLEATRHCGPRPTPSCLVPGPQLQGLLIVCFAEVSASV